MPISSGTVSKGEKAKPKFQTLNLNNVFSKSTGESSKPNQLKTSFNKHGMSVLGKVPSARKPTNLPSLKSENTGNDPPVNLVPTGGPGWGSKPGETGPPPPPTVQQNTAVVPTPPITTINTSIPPPPIVDKSWSAKTAGKPSNSPNYNTTHQTPLFNQEFPSLSGNPSDVQYGPGPSLRPQPIKGSWIQGGSHPPTSGEVGNQQGTAPVQDHPTETLRPEVAAILPSFMQKQETHLQFASFSNPPPPTRLAQRFSQPNSNHDTRFMQHPPPSRNKDFVQCAKIVKEDALSKFDEFSKKGGWALHDSIDYDQKLNFSDDETEESENKENDISSRFNDKSGAISEKTTSHHIEDEVKQLKKKEMNEIIEKAKVRKESEEQRFIEQKNNAAKKLAALDKKIEESKKENELKDERKTTGQPVVKDGNEFRQLTQLGTDKPQSYNKEPANNFTSSRFSTSNKPPRLRKQEEMQHKGFYSRPSQERNYYEGDYERDNRSDNRYRDYNSRDRFSMNNRDTRDREYSRGGYENRKFSDQMRNSDQKSGYNRDSEAKYQGRYSDSSDHRDSWEMLPKRKDSDRSKQSYDDDNERYRSDNESREKNNKDMNPWEINDYENHSEYEREEMWEKERRIERPTRPDSRDSRASRESKTSHSELNLRDDKLNVIDDPEEIHEIERERKPMNMNMYKNTRGAGVPITIEKLEAAESKQDKSSELVPLVRSDKGDYKKDGKDEDKKHLDAWSTPLNTSKFHSEHKKEDSPPIETEKPNENSQDKQTSEENGDKDKDRKEDKESANKKERGDRDRDTHHRDRGNRGRDRYQSSRSNEWSSNSYSSGGNRDNGRSWGREGKDSRETRYDNRRGHGRAPPARVSYPRHPRSESDPESGKEDRYHDGARERRVEKGRKERDDAWYGERDRYGDRKERDRYYESRGSREYPRGGGGSNYRSSNQPSGQGRRNDNYSGSSKNNFSGDEKKPREKKEATSEDDKKEKKSSAKPLGNKPARDSKTEKDWESDGKDSLDDDKYKRGGNYSSRGSRGSRSSYSASGRKNDKFTKERPVKEEIKEDIENSESNNVKSKESGDKPSEHGFQEVKAKKNTANVKDTSNSASKKTDEKSKPKETPKSGGSSASSKQNVLSGNQSKSANSTSKGSTQQTQSKPSADKGKNESNVSQQKKSEPTVEESKTHGFSLSGVKDIVTGPAPPPPATNAWDRPLNASVLKSSSPAPLVVQKTQTPPPRPASSASSNAGNEIASHSVDESTTQAAQQQQQQQQQQHLQNQQQQQQQHLQSQQQQYAQYQQQVEHQQQQAQLAAAVQAQQQKQHHHHHQYQQQVQQQVLDKIDTSLLDGTSTSVPTIIFENRAYKGLQTMDDYKQQDLGCKEDNSAADMKLDFTYGSELSSAACEDGGAGGHKGHGGGMSHHMVQSSAVELNWKIASVKSVWEDNESKQSPQADVNAAFPPQHSGSSAHFTVPDASSSPVSGQGGYCKTVVSSGPGSGGGVDNSGVECVQPGGGADQSPATVAELMYGAGVPRSLQQQQQQAAAHAVYASMSHKDAQELVKLNKQHMQAAAAGGAPTGAAVLTTPPPPQQQQQAPSYPPAPLSFAPNPAAGPHQYSTLPSPAAAAALLSYNTAFGSYSLGDQTAQLMSSAPGPPRQTTTQYPYLGLGQTAYNQAGNMFIHQASTPAATSGDLTSQLPPAAYRLPASAYGPNSAAPQLSAAGAPPNPTTLYMSAASVKQTSSGVGAIGTKTNYQPTQSQLYMFDPSLISPTSYLSQTQQQQRAAAAGSFFNSTGTAGGTAQSPAAFYSGSAHYAASSPYGLSYGGQSPAPTGQQQMGSAGMGKPVVGKYSQPPPQASQQQQQQQQQAQVKYSAYPSVAQQAQMMQQGGQASQQVLIQQHQQQQAQQQQQQQQNQ